MKETESKMLFLIWWKIYKFRDPGSSMNPKHTLKNNEENYPKSQHNQTDQGSKKKEILKADRDTSYSKEQNKDGRIITGNDTRNKVLKVPK
jgi:hypothetical protein